MKRVLFVLLSTHGQKFGNIKKTELCVFLSDISRHFFKSFYVPVISKESKIHVELFFIVTAR